MSKHKGYNSVVNSSNLAQNYKYNGKELNEELGLDWYDYGARNYDAALGRWSSVDNFAELAYELTPYRYSFNNPINYKDPDGNFELDPEVAKNNPELVKYLKGLVEEWKSKSDDFKNAFYETSGLTEAQTIEMLTYGNGPKLTVENLDVDTDGDGKINYRNGTTSLYLDSSTGIGSNVDNGKGLIKLDDDVVNSYTNAQDNNHKEGGKVLIESTLFHESVHYGRAKTGKTISMNENGNSLEAGKEFEKRAYGQDISRSSVKKYVRNKERVLRAKSIKVTTMPVNLKSIQVNPNLLIK